LSQSPLDNEGYEISKWAWSVGQLTVTGCVMLEPQNPEDEAQHKLCSEKR